MPRAVDTSAQPILPSSSRSPRARRRRGGEDASEPLAMSGTGECERETFTLINCRKLFVLTLGGPNELLNLFIFSATALVAGRENG